GGGDGAERAAVERAVERNDLVALGLAPGEEVMACCLDRTLDRLGARIGEEDGISEGIADEPLGKSLALRDREHVRSMPHLVGGVLERPDQVRVAVAQCVHRDACVEVEISGSILREEADALAPLESEWRSGVGAV